MILLCEVQEQSVQKWEILPTSGRGSGPFWGFPITQSLFPTGPNLHPPTPTPSPASIEDEIIGHLMQ